MKHTLSFFFCLLSALTVGAQAQPLLQFSRTGTNYVVYGQVQDYVTRQPLVGAKAQILTPDSVLLFEWTTNAHSGVKDTQQAFILLVPKAGDYLLRFSKEGYVERTMAYRVDKLRKAEPVMLHDPVLLRRKPKETALGEATVKATKVKFYMRGDTIVYNADAFQLEEGSMLDALIRQLPGAELKDDGRIMVNGKQVESLLFNGEDFFRKDRSIMLDNLPTYMVHRVEVYEKSGQMSQLVGRDIGDKRLVMDVRLKKQYDIGWLGNVETAGGSHERYLARLFALRFTAHSRVSAFANMNNVNDRQRPGVGSEWMPTISDGLGTTRQGGMDYLINDRRKRFKLEGEATVNHTDTRRDERTASVAYLPGGDVFGRERYMAYAHSLSVATNHSWTFNSRWVNVAVRPSFSYTKNRGNRTRLAATADHELVDNATLDTLFAADVSGGTLRGVINRTRSMELPDGHDLTTGLQAQASIRLPHTIDNLLVEARGYYTENRQEDFRHKLYDYPTGSSPTDLRNEAAKEGTDSRSGGIKLTYVSWLLGHNWMVMPSYEFAADHTAQRNPLYRLDGLYADAGEWPAPGVLPSVTDWMERTFDPRHSVFATAQNRYHVVTFRMRKEEYMMSKWAYDFTLPLSIDRKRMDYCRPALVDTALVKHYVFFRPSFSVRNRWVKQTEDGRTAYSHEMRLGYEMGMEPPAMSYFVNVRSDDNPLEVYTGNDGLQVTQRHKWSAGYTWNNALRHRLLAVTADYQLFRNAVAMGYDYNRETGVKTFRPENVNGNSSATARVNFSTPLDRKQQLTLDLNTDASYYHSADLRSDATEMTTKKSFVNTSYLTQGVNLNYAPGRIRLKGKAAVTFTTQHSKREDFTPTDAADFHYGLTLTADMPLRWQFSTDATMYCRRGYSDSAMNDDCFIWNMRLSKKLMKGRLSLMLDGFDVLGNLSNVSRRLDVQGHTETWYLSIPRYAMLHIVYRINDSRAK